MNQYRVVIIEDHQEIREAFAQLISMDENYFVCANYDNCEEAIQNLHSDCPDIILMDINLKGMDGIEGTKIISKNSPKTSIIIITVMENSESVFNALCAGATGYITKNSDKSVILNALNELINGGAPMSTQIAKMVVQSFQKNSQSPLTPRETEILSQLASGKSYQNIGNELFISKDTVKFHLKNIYLKLQVSNKAQAIELANKNKYI